MRRIVVVLVIIFFVTVVGGRNLNDDSLETEDSGDRYQDKHVRDHTNNQRHRLRRPPRQSFFNQFSSYNPYDDYNGWRRDDRRDYSRQHEQLLSGILYELKELSNYVKKQTPPPPPPPQIIYVPFPYPVQQCLNQTNPKITIREFPEDLNQNWGLIPDDLGLDDDDGSDGSRPISFDPILSNEPTVKPPPVEHGSSQAGCDQGMSDCRRLVRNRRVQFYPGRVPSYQPHKIAKLK